MKLSEALILRADCQKRIQQLRERLERSAKVQEGETPFEEPQALIAELDSTVSQLTELIQKINKTNSRINLEDGTTIADALAQRDILILKRSVYNALVQAAATQEYRYSRSEIKSFSTVNIAQLQAQVDRMSRDYRELDTKIQQANWNTELID
jgi:hypothetical protein